MRHTRWLTVLLTLALLGILAFVAGALTAVPFPAYFTVAVLAWLLTLGVQRAFRDDDGGYGDLDNEIREGRTGAARLQALIGRVPGQPGGF